MNGGGGGGGVYIRACDHRTSVVLPDSTCRACVCVAGANFVIVSNASTLLLAGTEVGLLPNQQFGTGWCVGLGWGVNLSSEHCQLW